MGVEVWSPRVIDEPEIQAMQPVKNLSHSESSRLTDDRIPEIVAALRSTATSLVPVLGSLSTR